MVRRKQNLTIFILLVLISVVSYSLLSNKKFINYFSNKKDKTQESTDNLILNNYDDNIKVINVSNKLNTNSKYDYYYDNSIFIGNEFLSLYNDYLLENNLYPNVSIFGSKNLKLDDITKNTFSFSNTDISLKDALNDKNRIFLMFGINELQNDSVENVITKYTSLLKTLNKDKEVYVISELYYNKTMEEEFIENSKIREFNYKMSQLEKEYNFNYINFSHSLINSTGYTTTEYFEKGQYKVETYNVFTNILRDLSYSKIDLKMRQEAKLSIDQCEKELTYEICDNTKKLVENLNKGSEKDSYSDKIVSLYLKLDEKYSLNLESLYVNKKEIYLSKNTNYYLNVDKDVTEALVEANCVSSNAKIVGLDNYILSKGNNLVRLTIENQGKTKIYNININREINTKIDKVTVNNKEIDLDTLIAKIDKNATSIDLKVYANDPSATIKGTGIINISENDSNINFIVNGYTYTMILEKK